MVKSSSTDESLKTICKLVDNELISEFKRLVTLEKKTTAEILLFLKEIESRKLFLELGHTSLFSYLTKGLGYSESSALRRINAARLLEAVPEIKNEIESGTLNLMQVSMVAGALKQKEKEQKEQKHKTNKNDISLNNNFIDHNIIDKKTLLMKVKNLNTVETQKVIAQTLDLEIKSFEKKTIQKDESVRAEITLTKDQMESLERVKQLISHTHPNPSISDLVDYLAKEFIKRKDPSILKAKYSQEKLSQEKWTSTVVVKKEAKIGRQVSASRASKAFGFRYRDHIPVRIQRQIHQRDLCCQWVDPKTNQKCASRFQTQIDHIIPVHRGGKNEVQNLQLLCSTHNQLKYLNEMKRS